MSLLPTLDQVLLLLFCRHVKQVPISSVRMMQHFAAPGRVAAIIEEEVGTIGNGKIEVSTDWFGRRLLVASALEEGVRRDRVVRRPVKGTMCFSRSMLPTNRVPDT